MAVPAPARTAARYLRCRKPLRLTNWNFRRVIHSNEKTHALYDLKRDLKNSAEKNALIATLTGTLYPYLSS